MTLYNISKCEVKRTEDEAVQYVDQLLKEGVKENQIVVLSKDKLNTDRFHDSQIQHKTTTGTISEKFMRFFIGEDGEEAALTKFGFSDEQKEDLKQDILNDKIVVMVQELKYGQDEYEKHNVANQKLQDKHAPSEHQGDIE
ncbi:general stress protein [Staphylococcus pseudintermedius]|nr:general stress protein [Staphylococcus pseudintermedius]EII6316381.1 general stress protein [Staphylococcus pseudintermedius]EJO7112301.1 general stress protein [Staphylococcus pseudintermedius]HAR6257674.1 general stress protein [Staphylococcus pseudintermedius]